MLHRRECHGMRSLSLSASSLTWRSSFLHLVHRGCFPRVPRLLEAGSASQTIKCIEKYDEVASAACFLVALLHRHILRTEDHISFGNLVGERDRKTEGGGGNSVIRYHVSLAKNVIFVFLSKIHFYYCTYKRIFFIKFFVLNEKKENLIHKSCVFRSTSAIL